MGDAAFSGNSENERDTETNTPEASLPPEVSQRMLLNAAHLARLGYWVWDHKQNRCIYCSDELAGMHQLSVDQYLQCLGDPAEMFDWIVAADRDCYVETWYKCVEAGHPYTIQVRFIRRDGSFFHGYETGQPIFDGLGNLLYTAGTLQDVTEFTLAYQRAQLAEQRLRDAVEALPDGFLLFDKDDCFVLCNSRYREMYPYIADLLRPGVPFEQIVRGCVERGHVAEAQGGAEEWIAQRLAAHRDPNEPLEEQLPDGRWIRVQERITRQGENVGFRVDITDLKRQQQALREMAEDLEYQLQKANEAHAAKNQFLASVSHELRTPLNAIVGFSEVLCGQHFGSLGHPRYEEYAKHIHDSGTFLLSLVNDLIEIGRLSAGTKRLEVERHSVRRSVAKVLPTVWPRAVEAGIRLRARIGRELPKVQADERALRQILINLLSNAVKFTPSGGRVVVSARVKDCDTLAIDVTDTGKGIPSEKIPELAKPFQKLHSNQHKTSGEGMGLGLAIVKTLTEEMGGSLEMDSEVEKGTRVTVLLPIAQK